jgi:hypothetical protein
LALLVSNAQDELPRESLVVVEVPKGSEDSRPSEAWPIGRAVEDCYRREHPVWSDVHAIQWNSEWQWHGCQHSH